PDAVQIKVNPNENKLAYELRDDKMFVEVILNGNTYEAEFNEATDELKLSLEVVMGLIGQHKLTKKDFYEADSAFTEDGTVKDGMKFFINSLMVGTKRIYDIEAICVHGQTSAIIFGDAIMTDMYQYRIDKEAKEFIFE
ncbi:MAG: hypothetical protein JXR34_07575, partial [Bacteroidales bacterium]|nr:hypothetical protein [Bacteroidales bacterium]